MFRFIVVGSEDGCDSGKESIVMLCVDPMKIKVGVLKHRATSSGFALVPCGHCLNCSVNKARIWTSRIILEACSHDDSSFVTLTYDQFNLPDPPVLSIPELQKFIKRVRWHSQKKLRYFAVGEYGDENQRPHYHIIFFGIHNVIDWIHLANSWTNDKGLLKCEPERLQALELTPELARYSAGYITKKAKDGDNRWIFDSQKKLTLSGLREWAIMSKGIGKDAVLQAQECCDRWDHEVKVLRSGGKKYPIGRYLKSQTHKKRNWVESILEFRAGQERAFEDRYIKVKMAKITNTRRLLE